MTNNIVIVLSQNDVYSRFELCNLDVISTLSIEEKYITSAIKITHDSQEWNAYVSVNESTQKRWTRRKTGTSGAVKVTYGRDDK